MIPNTNKIDERVEKLFADYQSNRHQILNMVIDLEQYVGRLKTMIPDPGDKDFRNNYVFENKIKLVTEFFKIILEMRKEVGKLLKDEISLINKLEPDTEDEIVDIHKKVKEIDKFIQENSKTLKVRK